jgi:hypothetical protein
MNVTIIQKDSSRSIVAITAGLGSILRLTSSQRRFGTVINGESITNEAIMISSKEKKKPIRNAERIVPRTSGTYTKMRFRKGLAPSVVPA